MGIRVAILDDTSSDILRLSNLLYELDSAIEIETYSQGQALLNRISKNQKVCDIDNRIDIIFLDIYMPGETGIAIAKQLRLINNSIKIIMTTTSRDHYSDAYAVFAFNYLEKPINKERLAEVYNEIKLAMVSYKEAILTLKCHGTEYFIEHKAIAFLESDDKQVCVHLTSGETFQCYEKLSKIMERLSNEQFLRCHQSYVINMAYIKSYNSKYFEVLHHQVGISKRFVKESRDRYYAYLFSRMGKGV
ncbi:LytR/AlgR family response regulator transcription factor [Fusibacter bizertensis]